MITRTLFGSSSEPAILLALAPVLPVCPRQHHFVLFGGGEHGNVPS